MNLKRLGTASATFFLALLVLCTIGGCPETPKDDGADAGDDLTAEVTAPPKLKLLIIDTPGIASEIERQWSARRDGELDVREVSWGELVEGDFQLVSLYDVIIFPGMQMGELVSRETLMEIPREVLNGDQVNKNEILRIHRTSLIEYGTATYGLPMGSPQFVLFASRGTLESVNREFPKTWDEMASLLRKVRDKSPENAKLLVPMDDSWAGYTFLALVGGQIRNRGSVSTIFDIDTGEPLIQRAPFVRMLTQLKEQVDVRSASADPEAVYRELVGNKASFGVTWASAVFDTGDAPTNNDLVAGRIPGSKTWYDFDEDTLIPREIRDPFLVDLIGFDSRLVAVSAKSDKVAAALDFAGWLVSKQISLLVVPKSRSGSPFRASHLGNMPVWTGNGIGPQAQEQIADILRTTDDESLVMMFPRVPGANEYMAVLNSAVRRVVFEDGDAQTELDSVASQWDAITDRLGRRDQIRWMRRSEGLAR